MCNVDKKCLTVSLARRSVMESAIVMGSLILAAVRVEVPHALSSSSSSHTA